MNDAKRCWECDTLLGPSAGHFCSVRCRDAAGAGEDGRGGRTGEKRGAARSEGREAPQPDRIDHPAYGLYGPLPNDPEDA